MCQVQNCVNVMSVKLLTTMKTISKKFFFYLILFFTLIVDTIEGSIDHTTGNVESGTSELLKAAEYQARYRRKVAILLIIAVIIGLIVTGLVVSQLKS